MRARAPFHKRKERRMEWYRKLYTDRTTEKRKKKIVKEIDAGIYRGNTYLITLAANPENMLEILSVHQLAFSYLRRTCPMIVGIACCRESALLLLERMINEIYEKTGTLKIREYFMSRDTSVPKGQ